MIEEKDAAPRGEARAAEARQTGSFEYDVKADRWHWDDDVFTIHGYRPGEVEPTTELFLRHKHDGDRERVEELFWRAVTTGEPLTMSYRLIVRDEVRRVVFVGSGERGPGGEVERLTGYYLDLTPEFDAANAAAAAAAVEASAAARDTIEQAKGVLMLGYGLDPDAAFAMLRWWSRNRNVKLRELAEGLIDVAQSGTVSHPGLRNLLDGLLHDLTAPTPLAPTPAAPTDRPIANPD
ncbi:ANTAR domain-containing protein [Nocardioides humilatus]|uniref:ANTAR domain-containing protein n=1 Tax=Nocardioides humilatus TaxID=2607660 RepID=A0A5B1LHJ4_9ACTN|nr:ANTAR domain-containing protein [Nocardioides humilatus]KAA1419270.1 ANTAR domain-containing protein [Nocardioides humilatus]